MSIVNSVILTGVGGQGILLASNILARAALLAGHDVKTNEVHGMAQRGGSVVAEIRYGEKVHSPLLAPMSAMAATTSICIARPPNAHPK
jgi:indolepyruvate ferredoxin oxidoreductase beta subunit